MGSDRNTWRAWSPFSLGLHRRKCGNDRGKLDWQRLRRNAGSNFDAIFTYSTFTADPLILSFSIHRAIFGFVHQRECTNTDYGYPGETNLGQLLVSRAIAEPHLTDLGGKRIMVTTAPATDRKNNSRSKANF